MKINYIVTFKNHQIVTFDIEFECNTIDSSTIEKCLQLEAYKCIEANGYIAEDVSKIAVLENINFDKINAPSKKLPSSQRKFTYTGSTLRDTLVDILNDECSFDATEYKGIVSKVDWRFRTLA